MIKNLSFLRFCKVPDGIRNAAVQRDRDHSGNFLVSSFMPCLIQSSIMPTKHVFIKICNKTLIFIRYRRIRSLLLLFNNPMIKSDVKLKQKILNLFPADAAVGIHNKRFVLINNFKNLQQSFCPCTVSLLARQCPCGIFRQDHSNQIINILKMIVKQPFG
mgnify:CR=1 FL=1